MTLYPSQFLKLFEVSGHPNVYLAGSHFPRKVYVYAQQARSVNIVHACRLVTPPHRFPKLLVIGGGAAGLSAAAAGISSGYSVTVCESETLLWIFDGCDSRYLCPKLPTWPDTGWKTRTATNVYLDWTADRAMQVSKQIRHKWQNILKGASSELRVFEHSRPTFFQKDNLRYKVKIEGSTNLEEHFDILVVATGFGRQPNEADDYWADRAFASHPHNPSSNVLIAGCGDGGVIDALRFRLTCFNDESVVSLLEQDWPIQERDATIPRIRDAEIAAALMTREAAARFFHDVYAEIQTPLLDRELLKALKPGIKVRLVDSELEYPFNINANPINRFLLSRLLRVDPGGSEYTGLSRLNVTTRQIQQIDGTTKSIPNNWTILRRFGSTLPIAKGPLADIWNNRPDTRFALSHMEQCSEVRLDWIPPKTEPISQGLEKVQEEFRPLLHCGDQPLSLRLDSPTYVDPYDEFQALCYPLKGGDSLKKRAVVAWNVQPVSCISLVHLIYLRQLRHFVRAGFNVRLVVFDVLKRWPMSHQRDRDRVTRAFVEAARSYLGNTKATEIIPVSDLLRQISSRDLMQTMAVMSHTISGIEVEPMTPFFVLDHLVALIIEEFYCRQRKQRQHDILLCGGFDESSYWSRARKKIVSGDMEFSSRMSSPLLLIFGTIPMPKQGKTVPCPPDNDLLPMRDDSLPILEAKLENFSTTHLEFIGRMFKLDALDIPILAQRISDEFALIPRLQ